MFVALELKIGLYQLCFDTHRKVKGAWKCCPQTIWAVDRQFPVHTRPKYWWLLCQFQEIAHTHRIPWMCRCILYHAKSFTQPVRFLMCYSCANLLFIWLSIIVRYLILYHMLALQTSFKGIINYNQSESNSLLNITWWNITQQSFLRHKVHVRPSQYPSMESCMLLWLAWKIAMYNKY